MNWFQSLAVGFLAAIFGALVGGYVAAKYVDWFHVSSFEGNSGYFVILYDLLSAAVCFCVGVVASRFVTPFARAVGFSVAIILALAAFAWLIGRFTGDVAPLQNGETLRLLVEVKPPEGWDPTTLEDGGNYLILHLIEGGATSHSELAPLQPAAGSTPQRPHLLGWPWLFASRGKYQIAIVLGGKQSPYFALPTAKELSTTQQQWSAWSPESNGTEPQFRYRAVTASQAQEEEAASNREANSEAARQLQSLTAQSPITEWLALLNQPASTDLDSEDSPRSRAGEVIRSRPNDLIPLLESSDPEQIRLAILGLPQLNEIPSAFSAPLLKAATTLAAWLERNPSPPHPKRLVNAIGVLASTMDRADLSQPPAALKTLQDWSARQKP